MLYLALAAIGLGVLVGLARGGSPGRLLHVPLRGLWLAVVALGLQAAMFLTPIGARLGEALGLVHVASYLLLLVPVALNWHLVGMRLVGLGLALNTLAIAANGGFMPVSADSMRAAGVGDRFMTLEQAGRIQKSIPMTAESRLGVLGDWVPLPGVGKVISLGDVAIAAGGMTLVAAGMGRQRRNTLDRKLAERQDSHPQPTVE